MPKPSPRLRVELSDQPGHLARRIHQLAVALFAQELGELNVTPVQYSSLQAICDTPGLDQTTIAKTIGIDTSTIGSVIDRLESRGLVTRRVAEGDRRVRNVHPTPEGEALLQAVIPAMLRSQAALLQPLSARERGEFVRLLKKLAFAGDAAKPPQ
jgi:DNA-binding MarR family transcriptional regulator